MMTKVFEQQGLLLECDFQDHDQETWWISLTDESGNVTKRQISLHLTKIILSGVYSYRPMCHGCFKPYRFEGSPEGVEYCQNEIEEFGIEASIGDSRSDTGWAEAMRTQYNILDNGFNIKGGNKCTPPSTPEKEIDPADLFDNPEIHLEETSTKERTSVCKRCGKQISYSSGWSCGTRKDQPCIGWSGERF